MIGLLGTLIEKIYCIFNRLQNLRLIEKLLIQGLILAIILTVIQLSLDGTREAFMLYLPPLGFFFLMFTTYLIQPIVVGVINIFIINVLFGTRGWQVGFWLNGLFLLLMFSTVNVVLQTALGLPFAYVAAIDIVLLALPFGCIARFSNGGWNKPIN